jgi:hypothetical protein
MRPLSVQEMIGVWEKGELRSPVDQALLLLQAGEPEESLSELAKLHVGERDRRLLQLREKTFGSRFSCSADCPWCSEDLHFEFETRQIVRPSSAEQTNSFSGTADEVAVRFRLPNSEDLADAMGAESPEESRLRILERCLLSVQKDGGELRVADLPESSIEKICDLSWQTTLDVTTFFWKEVSVRARRALSEVHLLASTYGWSEREILNMSPVRRGFYLQMVNA